MCFVSEQWQSEKTRVESTITGNIDETLMEIEAEKTFLGLGILLIAAIRDGGNGTEKNISVSDLQIYNGVLGPL